MRSQRERIHLRGSSKELPKIKPALATPQFVMENSG